MVDDGQDLLGGQPDMPFQCGLCLFRLPLAAKRDQFLVLVVRLLADRRIDDLKAEIAFGFFMQGATMPSAAGRCADRYSHS